MEDATSDGNWFVMSIACATGPVGREELRKEVGAGVMLKGEPESVSLPEMERDGAIVEGDADGGMV